MNPRRQLDILISPLGDRALSVRLTETVEAPLWSVMAGMAYTLRAANQSWIVDVVPAYDTVTVVYDPLQLLQAKGLPMKESNRLPYDRAAECIQEVLQTYGDFSQIDESPAIEIPVCYGGIYGPDLREASQTSGMSEADFVERHASAEYLVVMIGFMPGFPYLTGLPSELSQARRSSPRSLVPAGSVGIAGNQTGIYPLASPGGWQLIGRTSLRLFDPKRHQPSLLQAGSRLRFVPIDPTQMQKWSVY